MNWKYTDATNRVVARTNVGGASESCLVSAITEWLSEGNTPEPADVPTFAELKKAALDTYRATRERNADGASIPADPANTDYAAYLAWLAAGNAPLPADPIIIPKPTTLTMRQARLALNAAGLLDTVTAAVNASPDPTVKIEWESATSVERNWPTLATMQSALGLTDAQIDGLFLAGSTL